MATIDLDNTFTIEAALDDAWGLLDDLGAIAPCLPGAQLREVVGDEYRGDLALKVGPIAARYSGVARIVERVPDAHRVTIGATGNGSQGSATARIVVALRPAEGGTEVRVTTALELTGRIAQFGRTGTMAEISERMIDAFAANLARQMAGPGEGAPPDAHAPATPAVDTVDVGALLRSSPSARRGAAGVVVGLVVVVAVVARRRARRRTRSGSA